MKKTFSLGLSILLLSSPLCAVAQVISATIANHHIEQYARVDIDVNLRGEWRDPYDEKDIALDVELSSPSGKQLTLPAFYVDGESKKISHWQARFTPQEAGAYEYKFKLRDNGKPQKSIAAASFSVATSMGRGFLHSNNNWSLVFDNGEVFRGIGENFCWEHRDNDDSKFFKALHENPRFNYEDMLAKLSRNGSNFIRTWMIYWNLPVDWKKVQNASRYRDSNSRFNESGIKRMDELVNIAESNHMYLMLTLESHVGFMGSGWETSSYNLRNGGFAKTPREFFSSEQAKAQYKNKLRFMVARWGYSPSIAMWEFFNEIDNVIYAEKDAVIPDDTVTQWHKDMADYLARIDPYHHLITTSISHRDVKGLNDIANININQKHIYKATNKIPEAINHYVALHNKPYVIGESGYEWDWSKNFDEFSPNMISDFKRGLWYGLFSPTPVLPLSWWWEYFDEKGMTPYFQSVQEINRAMLQSSQGNLQSVALKTNTEVQAYAVKAGAKYFVYLFNPTDKNLVVDVALLIQPEKSGYRLQRFDPETGRYASLENLVDNRLSNLSMAPGQDMIFILQ